MEENLQTRIRQLKAQRNAVILAHNYQRPEVQDVADFVGDSLGLAQQAAQTDARVILFCGVHFMAETAALLCGDKRVIVPDLNAGCPMANMVTVRELRQMKQRHPDAIVLAYVNTTAAVKAEADICCTSANAAKILASLPREREVIFIPDQHLADYAARKVGREVIAWPGYCPTHVRILPDDVLAQKRLHPQAKVVVHPECRREVIELADHVASTTGILRYCTESTASEFIIGTEIGMLHRLAKENPQKKFYPASRVADCSNMKLNTLEKMVWALEDLQYEVTIPADIAERARRAIAKMLEIT